MNTGESAVQKIYVVLLEDSFGVAPAKAFGKEEDAEAYVDWKTTLDLGATYWIEEVWFA